MHITNSKVCLPRNCDLRESKARNQSLCLTRAPNDANYNLKDTWFSGVINTTLLVFLRLPQRLIEDVPYSMSQPLGNLWGQASFMAQNRDQRQCVMPHWERERVGSRVLRSVCLNQTRSFLFRPGD